MYKNIFSFFFLLIYFVVFGQDSTQIYARNIVDTLSSPFFSGRGYVKEGMEKAATYIENEFKEIGLSTINNTYRQSFEFSINVIQDAQLVINGEKLKYSRDFLVNPSSKSQSFQSKYFYHFNPKAFENAFKSNEDLRIFIQNSSQEQKGKHIVFPPYQFKTDSIRDYYNQWANLYNEEDNLNRASFLFTKDKLSGSLSQNQDNITQFIIRDKFYQEDLRIDNYSVTSKWLENYKADNLIGIIEGENTDSLIVISAHYDHLGQVGDVYFPGANDNASGVAMLLNLAKYFSHQKPKYSLIFISFAAEEAGLEGAFYFTKNPPIDLKTIKFLINLDMLGTGEEGIQVVNSTIFTKEYEKLLQINQNKKGLEQIKKRGEACNSDHCPFYQIGISSFYIYTLGGTRHYHDYLDQSNTLSLSKFKEVYELLVDFIEEI